MLRFFGEANGDRLIIVNLGRTIHFQPNPEPLLAPPRKGAWERMWCSEDPQYGGPGCAPIGQGARLAYPWTFCGGDV